MPNLAYLSGIFYFYLLFAQFGVFIGNIARRHTEIRGNLQRAGEDKSYAASERQPRETLGVLKLSYSKLQTGQWTIVNSTCGKPSKTFPVQKGALLASLGNKIFCLCSKKWKRYFFCKVAVLRHLQRQMRLEPVPTSENYSRN